MPTPTKPYYQYDLRVEIPATDVAVIVDALEGEAFSLRERIGKDALNRQIHEQQIKLDVRADEPGPAGGPLLHGWVILGRRGETERLALDVGWDVEAQALVDRGIDVEDARRRWKELPEWVRSSLTNQGAGPGGARG